MTTLKENEGPFAHSERIPKPNTLIQDSYYSGNVNISESLEGNVIINKENNSEMPVIDSDFMSKVYHASHIYILYFFIVLYLVIYVGLAFFLKKNGTEEIDILLKRIFDITVILIIIVFIFYEYSHSSTTTTTNENIIPAFWNWCMDWMRDPMNLYGIVFFSIAFYIWVFFMHINTKSEYTPFLIQLLEHKLWAIIFSFAIFFAIQYLFKIDIYSFFFGNELVNGIFTKFTDKKFDSKGLIQDDIPEQNNKTITNGHTSVKGNTSVQGNTSVKGNTSVQGNTISKPDEVFNIGNNLYSYEDAQHVCTAYGARLANYDEIEDAYNHGAEWCNYGWSDGQMAFFPTQKTTWDELQKNPKDKNKCGRPGVNGGYMQNKYLRFGVNCYGKKPDPKPEELARMNQPLPKTADEAVIDKKVEFWKKNADALLKVNSFNNNKWSEF